MKSTESPAGMTAEQSGETASAPSNEEPRRAAAAEQTGSTPPALQQHAQEIEDVAPVPAAQGDSVLADAALTAEEIELLSECEKAIEPNRKAFEELLEGLYTIKSLRLYRTGYSSFEEYCLARWGFQRAHAYRLLKARTTVVNLKEAGAPLPCNESQARLLTNLSKEDAAAVMFDAQKEAGSRQIQTNDIKRVKAASEKQAAQKTSVKNSRPTHLHVPNVELPEGVATISGLVSRIIIKLSEYELPQDVLDDIRSLEEEMRLLQGARLQQPAAREEGEICQTSLALAAA